MTEPRILVIGQPFSTNSGGGVTLTNLFRGWKKENLAVVCTAHIFHHLDTQACDNYYILGNDEYKWIFPLNLVQRKVKSGRATHLPSAGVEKKSTVPQKVSLRQKVLYNYFYPFLEQIGLIHVVSRIDLSDGLKEWISAFEPDVIYAQASSLETLRFCSLVHGYAQRPMVFHMMDDWPSSISAKGIFRHYWQRRIDGEFRDLLDKSTVLMGISDFMSQEYANRYGKEFMVFHNPVNVGFWKKYRKLSVEVGENPEILYSGRIGPGIHESLKMIAEAVDLYNQEHHADARFVLQTPEQPDWIGKYKSARYRSPVPYEELPGYFSGADILALPYDFTEESIKFIKYSMPTKAPEYMASGTPILIFAPPETAIVKDALKNAWASVVTVNDRQLLAASVGELLTSHKKRVELSGTAMQYASLNFDAEVVRKRFRAVFSELAAGRREHENARLTV